MSPRWGWCSMGAQDQRLTPWAIICRCSAPVTSARHSARPPSRSSRETPWPQLQEHGRDNHGASQKDPFPIRRSRPPRTLAMTTTSRSPWHTSAFAPKSLQPESQPPTRLNRTERRPNQPPSGRHLTNQPQLSILRDCPHCPPPGPDSAWRSTGSPRPRCRSTGRLPTVPRPPWPSPPAAGRNCPGTTSPSAPPTAHPTTTPSPVRRGHCRTGRGWTRERVMAGSESTWSTFPVSTSLSCSDVAQWSHPIDSHGAGGGTHAAGPRGRRVRLR